MWIPQEVIVSVWPASQVYNVRQVSVCVCVCVGGGGGGSHAQ